MPGGVGIGRVRLVVRRDLPRQHLRPRDVVGDADPHQRHDARVAAAAGFLGAGLEVRQNVGGYGPRSALAQRRAL